MKKIAIIDYSIGNLFSVVQACKKVGFDAFLASTPSEIENADGIILPGVGAFAQGMKNLQDKKLDIAIKHFVATGKPVMGICLGFQLFFDKSLEFEDCEGLGLIQGEVRSLKSIVTESALPVPKITWDTMNEKSIAWEGTPFSGLSAEDDFYFVHSYYCDVKEENVVLSTSKHGNFEYCASVLKNNVFGTQFHPEKSGELGLEIYENWKKYF